MVHLKCDLRFQKPVLVLRGVRSSGQARDVDGDDFNERCVYSRLVL